MLGLMRGSSCSLYALILAIIIPLAFAGAPTSFCKCTCFSNSTIIPLDSPVQNNLAAAHGLLFPRSAAETGDNTNGSSTASPTITAAVSATMTSSPGKPQDVDPDRKEYRAGNCNDCNRQFCLDYNLPICKKASMEDVFTICFQRDSRKDQTVVLIFIFATMGLLTWAAVRSWMNKWYEISRGRGTYNTLLDSDN